MNKRRNRPSSGKQAKVYRVTGRPAWTFFAGGWKTTTSAVS